MIFAKTLLDVEKKIRNLQITFISSFIEKHNDEMYSSMHQGRAEYVVVFLATTIMVLHVVLWGEVQ